MKKLISLLLSVVFLCGIFTSPIKAISVNHCETFRRSFYALQWYINRSENNIAEDQQFPIDVILDYTYSNCNFSEQYGRGNKGEMGYDTYAFPADLFETLAKKYFHVVNTNDLRSYSKSTSFYNIHYNETTNEYIGINPGGWGGAASYIIYGYTESNGKYTTYGYVGIRTGEKEHLRFIEEYPEHKPEKGYIYTGDTLVDGDKEILIIDSYLKSIVSYNGENVKFHSLQTIESIPTISGIITPDTKVDSPNNHTSSNHQSLSSNATTTTQNQSQTVSNQNNSSQINKPNTILSSSSTSSKTSSIPIDSLSPDTTVGIAQKGKTASVHKNNDLSSSASRKDAEQKSNNNPLILWMILGGSVLLVGGGISGYFLIRKKNCNERKDSSH